MLLELRLANLAVAAEASFELGPGLNVLTGSTGAGKSLVVEALRWLRGEPVDRDLLRAGAETASAEALFDLGEHGDLLARLDDLGVEAPPDGVLRLRREVKREGRSRAWVGERLSSAAVLRAITDELIELQSQHQQLTMLDPGGHRELLDAAGVKISTREDYDRAFAGWRSCEREIRAWRERQDRLREQRDLLEFQHRELERAHLRGDELEELRAVVAKMEGGARLMGAVHDALAHVADEERGALTALTNAQAGLRHVSEELTDLVEARDTLASALELVHEVRQSLDRFASDRDFDPEELARSQARLAELLDLTRKYGRTEAELIEQRERLGEQLLELEESGDLPARLRSQQEDARSGLQDAARALQRERKRVARRIAADAGPLLEDLGMRGAEVRFELALRIDPEGEIRVEGRRVRCQAAGPADVRLRVRTNPGEPFGPVEKVASGGELSRIGLVLRTLALAGRNPALILLDEVDAGLGADLGPALARRLLALARRAQVLVITHLPAVAAVAERHLLAVKAPEGERTTSRVETLDEASRVEELTRMLGGGGEKTRRLAVQLRQGELTARAEAGP